MNIFNQLKSFMGGTVRSFSMPWFTENGSMSKAQTLKEYRRYVYAITSSIASDVARIDFRVWKTLSSGKRDLQLNHPFIALMRQPNPDYTKFSFIELHQLYMELCGESFWYVVKGDNTKQPKYIKLLNPAVMDVAVDKLLANKENALGLVTGYILTKENGKKVPFTKDEIIHIKTPNPYNPYRGISPIEAAVEFVKTERLTSEFTMNSINNAGRPSGVLNIKGVVDKDEFEQIKKRFKYEYSGTQNAGKTMALNTKGDGSGVEFVKMGMEIGELALKEFKDVSRDDLMMMYKVSKTIMGITDDVNRASAKEAKSVWMENVIKPKMERLCDSLDGFVAKNYGADLDLDFRDPAPKYLEDRTAEWTAGHNKWLSTNDIIRERNEFMGTEIEEAEGGDEMYQSVALVPMGGSLPPSDTGEGGTNKSIKKKSKIEVKKTLTRHEFGEVFRSELFTRQKRWQIKYQEAINKILGKQQKEILSHNQKVFDEWLFDPAKYKAEYQKAFLSLGIELMREQAKVALNAAGDEETIFAINERVKRFIEERVNLFATEFDNETIAYIKTSLAVGYKEGESIGKLRKRIEEVYDTAKKMRSERVARTETIASSNEAALEAYKQSPVVSGQEWTTEAGACEYCKALDGKIVGLETNFANVGESISATDDNGNDISMVVDYGDLEHPPLHPNCECSILPVSVDMMTKSKILELEKVNKELKEKELSNIAMLEI